MAKARQHGPIDFDGVTVTLLASKHTLDKRKALKPLLNLLRDHDLTNRWGFPFHLQVRKDGKLFVVRHPRDIPEMLSALQLPALAPLTWPPLMTLQDSEDPRSMTRGTKGNAVPARTCTEACTPAHRHQKTYILSWLL